MKNPNERYKTTMTDNVSRYEGEVLFDKKDGYGIEHNEKSIYFF